MASKTSRPESDQTVIDMAELGARIARLRAELGITDANLTQFGQAPHSKQEGLAEGDQGRWREVVKAMGDMALHGNYFLMRLSVSRNGKIGRNSLY
jgi:uncharacterized small protein (DUF1192 family)